MKSILFFCLTLIFGSAFAQKGTLFPVLEGESLVHGEVIIPEQTKGKYTLIGLAMSKKSEELLKGWFGPVYRHFIKAPDPNALFNVTYDINVYLIPMLTGAKRPAYQQVMKKVEEDVDKQLHPHILFYQGSMKTYESALNITDKDRPYFFLLDESGTIVYATSGIFTDDKLQKIIDQLPF